MSVGKYTYIHGDGKQKKEGMKEAWWRRKQDEMEAGEWSIAPLDPELHVRSGRLNSPSSEETAAAIWVCWMLWQPF